jgi:hypothetical protein
VVIRLFLISCLAASAVGNAQKGGASNPSSAVSASRAPTRSPNAASRPAPNTRNNAGVRPEPPRTTGQNYTEPRRAELVTHPSSVPHLTNVPTQGTEEVKRQRLEEVRSSRISSRDYALRATEFEREARLSPDTRERELHYWAALNQSLRAVKSLEQSEGSLLGLVGPGTLVPLARAHLDVAREYALLQGHVGEAREQVQMAHGILFNLANQPLDRGWRWRVRYLLGYVYLLEGDTTVASSYFLQALDLNPNFVPTCAFVQYLSDDSNAPTSTCGASPEGGTSEGYPAPPPQTVAPLLNASAPSPNGAANPTIAQPRVDATVMSDDFKKVTPASGLNITPARGIAYAGTLLWLAAEVFEVAELGPAAALVTLAGMIADDVSK